MKTAELTALGITEEVASQILALNGKDIENAKATVTAAKDKEISAITAERDGLRSQLDTANETLKKFEGIDPQQIQSELQTYKAQAEEAERTLTREITVRDQRDWLTAKLDEYGVKSPLARRQIIAEVTSETDGLKWQPAKDGKPAAFYGFDDYMKAAHAEDPTLYQTAEEKAAAEQQANLEKNAPVFTGSTGTDGGGQGAKKYVPPTIF
mgnify:CR=1 FL=1